MDKKSMLDERTLLDKRYKLNAKLKADLIDLRFRGLTQKKLATAFAISQSYVSRIITEHLRQQEQNDSGGEE